MSAAAPDPYVLGVDIGTTTVKTCLVSSRTRCVEHSASRETKASCSSDQGPLGSEQDVHKICTALQFCVSRMPKEALVRVTHVAVSGQMHGVVMWKRGEGWRRNNFGRYETEKVSCLYTWQDNRCSPSFLRSLPPPDSHLRLSAGHGCATLLWLRRHRPDTVEQYDAAATVQDLVVAMLCGNEGKPVMSAQNAAGWGYFDTETRAWNTRRLEEADFPLELLPEVTVAGNIVGRMPCAWYGIPEGTPVFAALGDLQCSVFSSMETDHDAVMNLSTSAQLSFLLPAEFKPPSKSDPASPVEYFPYFQGRYLAVAASLNGGNVLAAFVKMLQQWTHELGLGVPESKIWDRITTLAQDDSSADTDLDILPTLYGERHLDQQRALVTNIDPHSLGLGKVSRSLFRGLVSNLSSMMPRQVLLDHGITRIIGSGTALTKNPVLQKELETQYDLPVVYGTGSDAAVGVALAVLPFL